MSPSLVDSLLLLARFANPDRFPEGLEEGLRALVADYFEPGQMEDAAWLVEGISHLLRGERMDWVPISGEDSMYQDLQSLLIELEMLYPEVGFNIDDDGICIAIKPNRSNLSLVLSRTGPQYRVV